MTVRDATPEQIEAGLQALIVHGGNSVKASEKIHVPSSTLRMWKKEHGEMYRRMELAYFDELEDATRSRAQEIAHAAGDLEAKLIAKINDQADSNRMDVKDMATALRSIADVKSKNIDKWLVLSNRSPEGAGNRDEDLWKSLESGVRSGVLKLNDSVKPDEGSDPEPGSG